MRKAFKRTVKDIPYWVVPFDFPADPLTGKRPPAKQFTGRTIADATAKYNLWVQKYRFNPRAHFEKGRFGHYLEGEFLAAEEQRTELGSQSKRGLSWERFCQRRSRITKLLADPDARELCTMKIRDTNPLLIKAFLEKKESTLTPSQYNKLRRDLLIAVGGLVLRTFISVHDIRECFPPPADETPRPPELFDVADLERKCADPKYPIEYRCFVAWLYVVNCRPQDQYALEWSDIDFASGTYTIDKRVAVVKGPDGKTAHEVVANISKHGKGALREGHPLGDWLFGLMEELKRYRMANGPASKFVFPFTDGGMMNKSRACRYWKKVREAMELPHLARYHLKHTGNSWAQANGVSAKVQAVRMGHSTTKMAETAYRRVFDEELLRAVNIFGKSRQQAG